MRIYRERAPAVENTWFGGRLGVAHAYRRVCAVGTALITEAVSTAHSRGCQRFLATVQEANARYFEREGAAVVIPDAELSAPRLAQEVGGLLADPERLAAMGRASATMARPGAARDIAGEVLAAARGRG